MSDRRVLMLPVDDERGASTRYRVLAHRPRLEQAGIRTAVRYPLRRRGIARTAARLMDMLRDVADRSGDLLFIHRKMYPPLVARALRGAARRIVVDMDDALDLPPPGRSLDERAGLRYRRNFEATTAAADLVICGNAELASRLPHERYELLPTSIDTDRFRPEALAGGRPGKILGWVGHSDNLAYLEGLAEPLREVARRHPELELLVVADRPPQLAGLRVTFRKWSLETELSCFRDMQVGLMPLPDTPWARSKCAFKAVQYMALGMPAVISPVGMNAEVVSNGENGFLPAGQHEWVAALDRLLSDSGLRREIGQAGRRTVLERYSLDVVSGRLVSILAGLLDPAYQSPSA